MGIDKVSRIQRKTTKEQEIPFPNILSTFRSKYKIRIKEIIKTSETKYKVIKMFNIEL